MSLRALGKMETALALTDDFAPLVLVGVVRLAGGPTPERLREALDRLQALQPALRVGIGGVGSRRTFKPAGERPIPLRIVERQADGDWQAAAEAELNQRLPAAGPLLRCVYLHAPGPDAPGEIVLSAHHSILDAAGALALYKALLALCAGGEDAPPEAQLPPPAESLFPPPYGGPGRLGRVLAFAARQMAGELAYQWRARDARKPAIQLGARCKLLTRRVPAELTTALVRRCRAERVSLNSALNAALLAAVHARLYSGAAMRLPAITFGNLRPYLKPPPAPESLGCYAVLLRYTAELGGGRGFWPLAKAIQADIYQGARRGDKFSAVWLSPVLVAGAHRLKRMRLAATALSYAGALALGPGFGAMRVVGLHGFVSDYPPGPEFTATVRLFRDELWWDCVYLDTDLDEPAAQAIAGEIFRQLEAAATSDPAA